MMDLEDLTRWFRRSGPSLLGYSGGVDSAVLAVVGTRALGPDQFLAVIGRSASYPEVQWIAARDVANRFGVPVHEIDTDELNDPNYRANAPDRCYHCKAELWSRLREVAAQRGFATIVDGSHSDDHGEHRPGAAAAAEHAVRSPLAELGWGKARVRAVALALGLPIWDAPAAPCLSSRIAYGIAVTPERVAPMNPGSTGTRPEASRGRTCAVTAAEVSSRSGRARKAQAAS